MPNSEQLTSKFRSLLHISAVLNANLDLYQLLPLIMLYSKDLLEAEASSLFLLDAEDFLYCEVGLGDKGETIQQYARLEMGEGIVGMVAKEKKPIILEDAYADPRFNREMDKKTGFRTRSLLCVPLFVEGKLIGTLEIMNKTRGRTFSAEDLDFLLSLSEVAAIAIQNANIQETLNKRILELSLLYEFEKLVVSEKSLPELGNWILNRVLEYLNATSGTIYEANPTEKVLTILAAKGIPKEAYKKIRVPYGEGISGWVASERKNLIVHNLDSDRRYNKLARYTFESQSLISAPLIYHEELLGVISINNKKSGYAFNQSDLDLLAAIAGRLSNTIKNGQLFHQVLDTKKELNRAKAMMEKIMPSALPSVPQLKYGVAHIPLERVGGDFYDVTRIDETRFSILIADISGHGLSAAVLAAMAHLVLKNFDTEINLSPSVFLTALNHMLYRKLAGNFLTTFYGVIDISKNVLLFSCAGHHPPLLLNKKTEVFTNLALKGKILGLIPDLFYEEKEVPFLPGDRVVLFTDGITEHSSLDRELEYDEDLFAKAVVNSLNLDAQAATNFLINSAKQYTKTEMFEDDVTLLILDRV